eukprot:4870020-Pyramimonas_sp.AAC.1
MADPTHLTQGSTWGGWGAQHDGGFTFVPAAPDNDAANVTSLTRRTSGAKGLEPNQQWSSKARRQACKHMQGRQTEKVQEHVPTTPLYYCRSVCLEVPGREIAPASFLVAVLLGSCGGWGIALLLGIVQIQK